MTKQDIDKKIKEAIMEANAGKKLDQNMSNMAYKKEATRKFDSIIDVLLDCFID